MESSPNQELLLAVIEVADRIERQASAILSHTRGVSLAEYRMLRALAQAPNTQLSRVDLADAVGLTASGVTRALVPLEKMGFVETVRDARDARKALASLRAAGLELVADASALLNDHLAAVDVSGADGERVLESLRLLARDRR